MASPDSPQSASDPFESEERLDKVRELLFGDTARGLEGRVAELADELKRTRELLEQRSAELEALRGQVEQQGLDSVDRQGLAASLRSLADSVEGRVKTGSGSARR